MNKSGIFKLWEVPRGATTAADGRVVREGDYDHALTGYTELTAQSDVVHDYLMTDAADEPCTECMTQRHPRPPVTGPSEAKMPSRDNKLEGGPAMTSKIG
jgi:hypothetical protein